MKSAVKLFILFLSSAVIVLIVAPLFQKGCFIDGMLYKTVSYNYAEGLASFWNMKFTDTSMTFFCEQPPLYFYLLSNFYKLFGVHYLTDRFFTLLLFIALTVLLHLILKLVFKKTQSYLLLTYFFLLAIPVFCWSYVNQVIEPLVCVFVSLGILFFIRFLRTDKIVFMILFGLVCYLLFLTKGFQSCFIVVLPLSYFLFTKLKKTFFLFSFISVGVFLLLIIGSIFMYIPAKVWFECYYSARLVLTIENVGNTTNNHFEIIGRFFSEVIVCLGIVVLLILYLRIKKAYPLVFVIRNFLANKLALALFITSLFGSFPYAISLVQRGFYLIPSFICFVLALVIGLRRYWTIVFCGLERIDKFKLVWIFTGMVMLAAVFYFCFNLTAYKRDEIKLKDIDKILPLLQEGETVIIESAMWNDFSLHSYLYMAKKISLSVEGKESRFLIKVKSSTNDTPQHKINLNTNELELYFIPKTLP
ncbi:ArnT family glycosyltransferase [Aurantibacillus circumpalustris]|uniref:ArnT family glycosyltransferase n=1 Tax=Aurantibacillus circumpalustris TaxID=3036359 RepID=UPI00295AC006|nr:glycosyltransferase family 39 protein [Aurantibacillus circumpalustris]